MKEIIDIWENFFSAQEINIKRGCELIVSSLEKGNKILIAGNGGSSAQSSHFMAEILGRYEKNIIPYPAVSLNSDISTITALSNDFGYENIFSYQIEGLGKAGDVFIALSTSGKSKNIIKAVEKAKEKKLYIISLVGEKPTVLEGLSDVIIKVPSSKTARVQEVHLYILHSFAEAVDKKLR
jgi:D-sedoheptulose 7-phosphate isomerase